MTVPRKSYVGCEARRAAVVVKSQLPPCPPGRAHMGCAKMSPRQPGMLGQRLSRVWTCHPGLDCVPAVPCSLDLAMQLPAQAEWLHLGAATTRPCASRKVLPEPPTLPLLPPLVLSCKLCICPFPGHPHKGGRGLISSTLSP